MPHSSSHMQMYGCLVNSDISKQARLACLELHAAYLSKSNDNSTWNVLSILCHTAAMRNGDIELCRKNEVKLSLLVQLHEMAELRLTAAERGSLPLWCWCNCTGSWSDFLIHEKNILTKKVVSSL